MHFKDLVTEVLDQADESRRRIASPLERHHLITVAFREAWPEMSDRVRRQAGLADSMLKLVDEFRQSLIDPDTLDQRLAGLEIESEYLERIAAVYRHYVNGLRARELTDNPARAMAASKASFESWRGRPVFLVGFDDLTDQQLELATRLGEQTDVTVAITHEDGNPAMAVTDRLLARLVDRGATVRETTERPLNPPDHSQLLYEVERDFMRRAAGRLVPDESIAVMRSSGHRGEAEAVAARIGVLVDAGTDPGQIAIAVTNPSVSGRTFRDLLAEYGVAVTLESETAASETAIGRTALALLKAASANGRSSEFIRYLRGPVGAAPELVDQLEFMVVRGAIETAREAAALFERLGGKVPDGWLQLTSDDKDAGYAAEAVSSAVLEMGEIVLARDPAGLPSAATVTEVQTARAVSDACLELKQMDGAGAGPDEISAAIISGAIKTWGMPTIGSVRIASPYSLRAKRFEHLFMVSLQEGGLAAGDRSGPFISADLRGRIGLPEFVDPELQELYLFYSCLSVPTRGLWLSCRIADESGKAEHPSPLLTAIEDLFPEGSIRNHGRSAEEIAFPVGAAPSFTELARTLSAAAGAGQGIDLKETELDDARLHELARRLRDAAEIEASTRTLASLSPQVASRVLAGRTTFSATALEAFTTCPYQWFLERAIRPVRFGPEPEPMARGSLVHAVLAEIYGQRLGSLPDPDTLAEWLEAVEPAVIHHAGDEEIGLDSDSAPHRILRRQAVATISRYLRIESEREGPRFVPLMTEARFGMDEDAPVDMGGWSLRGSIDRVDVGREGGDQVGRRGIVIDYKTGPSGTLSKAQIDRGRKLQLQLYLKALEGMGIQPVAGLYVPVHKGSKGARGIVDEFAADDLADLDHQKNDRAPSLQDEITKAVALADSTVTKIFAGEIDHDPLRCIDHFDHAAVPDPDLRGPARESAGIEVDP